MLEKITNRDRLFNIAGRLSHDRFKPGYDNMNPAAAKLWLTLNYDKLKSQIEHGRYIPMPAIGFRVAKKNGSFRNLARLCAIDTILQRSVLQVFGEACEALFSDNSHAYRTGRGTSTALTRFCEYASAFRFVAKIDPKNCYDNIDHAVLKKMICKFTDNKALVKLLMSFAGQSIFEDGELHERNCGVLQGAPISSLYCNIYLHCMDEYLTEREVPFVRYADDIAVFGNSEEQLESLCEDIRTFMLNVLHLELNNRKFSIKAIEKSEFLGQKFVPGKNGRIEIVTGECSRGAYCSWYSSAGIKQRKTVDVLSDGILRQKAFTLAFDSDTELTALPVSNTDVINIYSNVIFDTGSIDKILSEGITLNVFDAFGNLKGSFIPEAPLKQPKVTAKQLLAYNDDEIRLNIAKQFVLASIHNIRLNIRYYNKYKPCDKYNAALASLNNCERAIKICTDYEKLLLKEAQSKAAYFGCFDSFIASSDFVFERRSRRPPENEINAMISFGNTVLYNIIATEISKTALDVRVGFLHATNRRLRSLNLDIAEAFKPLVVDRTVFQLINRNAVKTDKHFFREGEKAVLLNSEGKKILLNALYDKLDSRQTIGEKSYSYIELIRLEIIKMIRFFRSGEKFVPFKQVR